ncbi:uncharacterized protein LOC124547812, partial [Schistocerca americana]
AASAAPAGLGAATASAAVVLVLLASLSLLPAAAAAFSGRSSAQPHYKRYSGLRVSQDSLLRLVHHEQTVALIELASPSGPLLSCEFIEVYRPIDAKGALASLSELAVPEEVRFWEMKQLMNECETLPPPPQAALNGSLKALSLSQESEATGRSISKATHTLLSGVVPGTKWCGAGDIAETYHDLGNDSEVDRCCRSHDLCPVKVRAFRKRYNLTNLSVYTKSHCDCDAMLYGCLKAANSTTAALLGRVYFNVLRVPCIEEQACLVESCKPRRRFRSPRQQF